eukprot:scaffold319851_cov31-Attheya_sp.AAC.1
MPPPTAPTTPMATPSDLSALVLHTEPSQHSRTSPLLLHTWSERVVGALLDVWSGSVEYFYLDEYHDRPTNMVTILHHMAS